MRCANAISSSRGRCPTARRRARSTTRASSPAIWRARWRSPTGRASAGAPPHRGSRAGCAASVSPPISRPAAAVGPETAKVTLGEDGVVTVLIGSQSTGQGHHTAYAQLVAEHLDLPPEQVRVIQGDTDADRDRRRHRRVELDSVRRRGGCRRARRSSRTISRQLAADALEASAVDLEIADARVRVAGTDRALSFAELARSPQAPPGLLATEDALAPPEATYPNGTHRRRGRDRCRHRTCRHSQLRGRR